MPADGETSYLRVLFVAGLILATSVASGPAPPSRSTSPAQKARVIENYGKLPLSFEANTGQADPNVKFLTRGGGNGLYLAGNEAALMLCQTVLDSAGPDSQRKLGPSRKAAVCDVVRMQPAGANSKTEPVGDERLQGTANYFLGSDPAKWRTNVPTYAKVRYPGIYPGIDLIYFGNPSADGQVEFDFVVAADAEPRRIRLRFAGPSSRAAPRLGCTQSLRL